MTVRTRAKMVNPSNLLCNRAKEKGTNWLICPLNRLIRPRAKGERDSKPQRSGLSEEKNSGLTTKQNLSKRAPPARTLTFFVPLPLLRVVVVVAVARVVVVVVVRYVAVARVVVVALTTT